MYKVGDYVRVSTYSPFKCGLIVDVKPHLEEIRYTVKALDLPGNGYWLLADRNLHSLSIFGRIMFRLKFGRISSR